MLNVHQLLEYSIRQDRKMSSPITGVVNIIVNCQMPQREESITLMNKVMKIAERVIVELIRKRISLNEKQFKFVPREESTDTFILYIERENQKHSLQRENHLYRKMQTWERPQSIVECTLTKLGANEQLESCASLAKGKCEQEESQQHIQ